MPEMRPVVSLQDDTVRVRSGRHKVQVQVQEVRLRRGLRAARPAGQGQHRGRSRHPVEPEEDAHQGEPDFRQVPVRVRPRAGVRGARPPGSPPVRRFNPDRHPRGLRAERAAEGHEHAPVHLQRGRGAPHEGAGPRRHQEHARLGHAADAAVLQAGVLHPASQALRRGDSPRFHHPLPHPVPAVQRATGTGRANHGVDADVHLRDAEHDREEEDEHRHLRGRPVPGRIPDGRRRGEAAGAEGQHPGGPERAAVGHGLPAGALHRKPDAAGGPCGASSFREAVQRPRRQLQRHHPVDARPRLRPLPVGAGAGQAVQHHARRRHRAQGHAAPGGGRHGRLQVHGVQGARPRLHRRAGEAHQRAEGDPGPPD